MRHPAVHLRIAACCLWAAMAWLAGGCATHTAPPVAAAVAPQFPEFVYPAVTGRDAAVYGGTQQAAWRALQAGDLRGAERAFDFLLKQRPDFAPAQAGLGYVALAHKQPSDALSRFDRALGQVPAYAPALVGRAQALVALGRDAEGLAAYEAAHAADPSLDLGPRIEVLRFRDAGDAVTDARRAAERGRLDDARSAYERAVAASPDSAFLYRELGTVEARAGRDERALELYRKAASLDASDARSHVLAGDLLAARGRLDEAAVEYAAALAIEPSAETEQKAEDARQRAEVARLPAEFQAIPAASDVTRGDVAAELGVRLAPWLRAGQVRQGVLLTDVRTHWAASWILAVVGAGIMEPFPNHTFQPSLRVRRADLAQIVTRALGVAAERRPDAARWRGARITFADVPAGHPLYPAISEAVAAGVLRTSGAGLFEPSRPATGAELDAAVQKLVTLFGKPPERR